MRLRSLFPIILALSATPAGAAMFKWTDADGNTQYGQHPPAGVQAERIKADPHRKTEPDATASPQERLKALEEQQQQQSEQASKDNAARQQAEQRKENCKMARQNLSQLKRGGHRRVRLPDGTVTYLSEEDKQSRITKAEKQVKDYCD